MPRSFVVAINVQQRDVSSIKVVQFTGCSKCMVRLHCFGMKYSAELVQLQSGLFDKNYELIDVSQISNVSLVDDI